MNDAPSPRLASGRPKLPALLYVLGVFGVLIGLGGSWVDWRTCGLMLESRDAYVADVVEEWHLRRDIAKLEVPANMDDSVTKAADARYARRFAALPLAAGGAIVGWLLALGALRAMMGDKNGVALWSWAATASLPFCALTAALGVLTAGEVQRALVGQPNSELMQTAAMLEKVGIVTGMVLGSLYYAACLLYLRKPALQARFSDGAERTKPSA